MYLLGVTCFMAALGVPINLINVYVAMTSLEKIATAEILIIHLSFANMLQLISQILTIVIPDQHGICYPMVSLCKLSLWLLCTSRRVSMLFTFYLGLFCLLKIKKKHRFTLSNACLHLALPGNWILFNFLCLPQSILIPDDRPSHPNVTEGCICSLDYSLTDNDTFVRLYNLALTSGSLYIFTALTCYICIHMVLFLLKHKQTVFTHGTFSMRTRQEDIIAIKAVLALLVCYVMCSIAICAISFFSESDAFHIEKIFANIHNVIFPFILGLGYPSFRKAIFLKCRLIQKSNTEQAVTIS